MPTSGLRLITASQWEADLYPIVEDRLALVRKEELAGGVGGVPGMATIRDASVRMALLASGVLAGVADALRGRSEAKSGT